MTATGRVTVRAGVKRIMNAGVGMAILSKCSDARINPLNRSSPPGGRPVLLVGWLDESLSLRLTVAVKTDGGDDVVNAFVSTVE